MNKVAAYIDSFVKRAQEYGLTEGQAVDFAKEALDWDQLSQYAEQAKNFAQENPELTGAGVGGLGGAALGAAMSDKPMKGALGGGAAGATIGGLAGNIYRRGNETSELKDQSAKDLASAQAQNAGLQEQLDIEHSPFHTFSKRLESENALKSVIEGLKSSNAAERQNAQVIIKSLIDKMNKPGLMERGLEWGKAHNPVSGIAELLGLGKDLVNEQTSGAKADDMQKKLDDMQLQKKIMQMLGK